MKIIQQYITRNMIWSTLLALFVLVSLFSFFSLIDQLGDTGLGNYGTLQALVYVLLTVPKLAYELFPIAAVIGSMTVLGILAQNSELDIIRTSGVSNFNLALLLLRSAMVLVILAVIVGEIFAPISEEKAQNLRSMALTEQIALKTKNGFWIRDGSSFINIRKFLPGDRVEQIYFYEFAEDNVLRSSLYAESAVYSDGHWLMEDIEESMISDEKVEKRFLKHATRESLLNPEMINIVTVKPQYLTFVGLARYIHFLKQNNQNTLLYEQALWSKFVGPFSIFAMIILAVPLVRGHSRFIAIGHRVFLGALIGIIFHLGNQVSANLGVVYGINPAISVTLPTIILITLIYYMVRD